MTATCAAAAQHGAVHLAERRGGDRFRLEGLERLGQADAQLLLHDPLDVGVRKRSDVVLQARERLEVRGRQQVRARRQELSELDEGRTELLEIVRKGPGLGGVAGQRPGSLVARVRDEVGLPVLGEERREVAVPAQPGRECHHHA